LIGKKAIGAAIGVSSEPRPAVTPGPERYLLHATMIGSAG
jgi:hypothetical protein